MPIASLAQNRPFAVYKITESGTIVTRYQQDLLTLMQLSAQGREKDVRSIFKQLTVKGSAAVLETGDVVRISHIYDNKTAQIVFGTQHGYIAQSDLKLRAQQ
jgi:hypothetical protein